MNSGKILRTIFIVFALFVFCPTAFAENWAYVTTAEDGSDLYVDIDNVVGTNISKSQIGFVVFAKWFGGDTAEKLGYSYAIDAMYYYIYVPNYSMTYEIPVSVWYDSNGRKIHTVKGVVSLSPLDALSKQILDIAEPHIRWVK